MKTLALAVLSLPALLAAASAAQAQPAHIAAAVAAADRPAADKARDANRKPAEMPGLRRSEARPERCRTAARRGLFHTHLQHGRGPDGQGLWRDLRRWCAGQGNRRDTGPCQCELPALYRHVHGARAGRLVWTSQNYHDAYNRDPAGAEALDKAAFAALKPGGIYIVLDHKALPGVGDPVAMHRIDPALVKKQVLAAGFQYVGESNALANRPTRTMSACAMPLFRARPTSSCSSSASPDKGFLISSSRLPPG